MSEAEKKFNIYLEKYCRKHKVSQEEAMKHRMVLDVKEYYEENEKGGDV